MQPGNAAEMGVACGEREAILRRSRCNPDVVIGNQHPACGEIVPEVTVEIGGRRVCREYRHWLGKCREVGQILRRLCRVLCAVVQLTERDA